MVQVVSCRELWHETETNPVRIRGDEFGACVRKERVDGERVASVALASSSGVHGGVFEHGDHMRRERRGYRESAGSVNDSLAYAAYSSRRLILL